MKKILFFFEELIKTLSNEPSFLSSKRIERCILFNVSVGIICCFVWYKRATISMLEVTGLVTLLFGYAGFNVKQLQKEKAVEKPLITPEA